MNHFKRKLLTIVAEAALESTLIKKIEKLGAQGFTITDARGKGSRGVRDAGWDASANIRIEVVCDPQVSKKIASYLKERYYADYAMIMFESDVNVMREDKF